MTILHVVAQMFDDFKFSSFRLIVIQWELRCRECEVRLSNFSLSFYSTKVILEGHLMNFRYIIILGSF